LKDNHLAGVVPNELPAFVTRAAARARELASHAGQSLSFIELEVDTVEQLQRVLDAGGCGVGIILLDNMTPDQLRRAVELRDRSGLAIALEASGGVRLDTVRAIAQTGVERISAGAITHQAVSRDIGLDIEARA
jgi:nicotinate-nucleotide pyrophosphorylase (carboxylating)